MKIVNKPDYDASSYAEADEHIQEVQPEGNEQSDPQSGEPSEQTPADSSGTNPLMTGPDPEERESEPECPDCGSNRYGVVDEHHDKIPEEYHDYDYVCADCLELYD
jgi:hypothetical protein